MDCLKKRKKGELITPGKEKKCVERYFFKYAFPCAQVKLKFGSLTQEKYDKLEREFLENNFPDREDLEKCFGAAFRRIKNLAEKRDKEMWDPEVIREYWEENHNTIIDEGDGMYGTASEDFKDLCKIHEAGVIGIDGDKLTVAYGNRRRVVSNFLVPEVELGDKVRIHYAFAIEII